MRRELPVLVVLAIVVALVALLLLAGAPSGTARPHGAAAIARTTTRPAP